MGQTDFSALCEQQQSSANTIAGLRADLVYWKTLAEERGAELARRQAEQGQAANPALEGGITSESESAYQAAAAQIAEDAVLFVTTGGAIPSGLRIEFHNTRTIDAPKWLPAGSTINGETLGPSVSFVYRDALKA